MSNDSDGRFLKYGAIIATAPIWLLFLTLVLSVGLAVTAFAAGLAIRIWFVFVLVGLVVAALELA